MSREKAELLAATVTLGALLVLLLLTGCMSAARLERGPGKDDCLATVKGNMPSFLTPSVIAECRPEARP